MILSVMDSSVVIVSEAGQLSRKDLAWNISSLMLGPIDIADVYFRGMSRLEFST